MGILTKNWNMPAPEWYRNMRDIIITSMPLVSTLEVSFGASADFMKHSDSLMLFAAGTLIIIGKYLPSSQVIVNQNEVKENVG